MAKTIIQPRKKATKPQGQSYGVKRDGDPAVNRRTDEIAKCARAQASKEVGAGMAERITKTAKRFDGALVRLAKR